MIRPQRMVFVQIICRKDDVLALLDELAAKGIMHLVDPSQSSELMQTKTTPYLDSEESARYLREQSPSSQAKSVEEGRFEGLRNVRATKHVAFLSGFVAEADIGALEEIVSTKQSIWVQLEPGESAAVRLGIDVPVKLKRTSLLAPFQGLLSTYGLPRYDELDPSVIFALSYVVLFGFMFGDVGQGLVLALLGWLWRRRQLAQGKSDVFGVFASLCGLSAVVFGFLYGSIFGSEEILHPLWLQPMEEINSLLIAGIVVGVLLISVGIILNLVNAWMRKDGFEGLFGECGLLSAMTYWALIAFGVSSVAGEGTMSKPWLWVAAASGLLFLLGHHFQWLSPHKEEGNSIVSTLLGLFDVFLRYLTNTVSFIRIAAFALAHAALGIAIYAIAETVHTFPLGVVWAGIVIVIGNIGVLALEGLIVGIQTLRLEFYEFFSKFFAGEGEPFSPLKYDIG